MFPLTQDGFWWFWAQLRYIPNLPSSSFGVSDTVNTRVDTAGSTMVLARALAITLWAALMGLAEPAALGAWPIHVHDASRRSRFHVLAKRLDGLQRHRRQLQWQSIWRVR